MEAHSRRWGKRRGVTEIYIKDTVLLLKMQGSSVWRGILVSGASFCKTGGRQTQADARGCLFFSVQTVSLFFVSFSSYSRSNRLHPLPDLDSSLNVKKMRKNADGCETSALYSERFSIGSVLCRCPSRLISTLIQSVAGTSWPVHSSEQALIMSSEQVHDQSIFTFLPFFVCTRACPHA